ncbi:MAG: OsmC family peroxiredoxin, partial [Comamonadaceae bacterium]
MKIAATVLSSPAGHEASVRTGDASRSLGVPGKPGGGSGVNGGEFLMLALATCYCNDLFREAGRLG